MKKITDDQCRDTGLALVLIALLVLWARRSVVLAPPAIVIVIITMTAPRLLAPLARLWFGFSHYLGLAVSNVLLTLVFLAVVTPVGLLRKISGKDAMGLKKWRNGQPSAFLIRQQTMTKADLEKPF